MISDQEMGGTIGSSKTFKYNPKNSIFHKYVKIPPRGTVDVCSVDIIIPFHGQYDKVRKLILSILEFTRSNPYKITLVDDCSPNQDFINIMSEAEQTQVIRLNEHSGYGAALEAGYNITEQPYVVFLHSDCEIKHPNWIEAMGESLLRLKSKNVRMVSARSDNPICDITELKGSKNEIIPDVIVDSPLPMYCVMAHRELYKRIGFIKHYPLTGYEGDEFAYRMKNRGYSQAIAGGSWVHHEGHATVKDLIKSNPKSEQIIAENYNLCITDIKRLH